MPRPLLALLLVFVFAPAGFAEAGVGADPGRILELELRRQLAERRAQARAQADGAEAPASSTLPGRAAPVAPTEAAAWEVDWDEYLTLIVVEPGEHLRRPAWIATLHKGAGDLAVAYAGTAFRDDRGDIHIDCRNAVITGPMASQWAADSFAIEAGGRVRIIDDAERGNPGRVRATIPARGEGGGDLTLAFRKARLLARMYVENAL
jgi:hypothetical protein